MNKNIRKCSNLIISIFLLFFKSHVLGENISVNVKINWKEKKVYKINEQFYIHTLFFDNCSYNEYRLPIFVDKYKLPFYPEYISLSLQKIQYEELSEKEIENVENLEKITEEVSQKINVYFDRKVPYAVVEILPLFNKTGKIYKVTSFDLKIEYSDIAKKQKERNYTYQSVLKTGNWYKISTTNNGIYQITYNDLLAMGINPAEINPRNIRIYGNGGGMLPESNSEFYYDDLYENAIYVFGEEDGKFDENDYILFYGTSANKIKYNNTQKRFYHEKNIYSDIACYFITTDLGPGKRIQLQNSSNLTPNYLSTTTNEFYYHNNDERNLMKSGREWFGEVFDQQLSYNFNYNFPGINSSILNPVRLTIRLAARCVGCTSKFSITVNGETENISIPQVGSEEHAKAVVYSKQFVSNSPNISIKIQYDKPLSSSVGYLDYIEIEAPKQLNMTGSQMIFRDKTNIGPGNITEFSLSSNNPNLQIWEITNPLEPKNQQTTYFNNNYKFVLPTDSLREFIAFDGQFFYKPNFVGKIQNQNLHGLSNIDMVIISPSHLLSEANRLAQFRAQNDGYQVVVLTPDLIYNEFSSGVQDASAIRNFMKMLYSRNTNPNDIKPRYLLLFGDGSYDFKNRLANNTNQIPTYQSVNSLSGTATFCSDDYFGLLDEGEGNSCFGLLDIGIGRFPVNDLETAKAMVDKVIRYSSKANLVSQNETQCSVNNIISNLSDWKNIICFIADDGDNSLHLVQAENTSLYVDSTYKNFNIEKIFCDAYPQISTPGGQRYPDVTIAINNRIERGALVINYTGHGGEVGWAHERILEISDINSWKNKYNMPVFITATCEFGRWDDPERTSAGELVFLNKEGGGASIFTTTRLVFASANDRLNKAFYRYVFVPINNINPGLGDVIRQAKNYSNSYPNDRNFTLLGDPGMKLALPIDSIKTLSITTDNNILADTIKAFQKVTVTGQIIKRDGTLDNEFNGIIYPTVYDKPQYIKTLGNDPDSPPKIFKLQKNIIYKGKASVVNGKFSFSFIVPKDINYSYGKGKISYYAENGYYDGSGYFDNFYIGGTASSYVEDKTGPDIRIYLNDEKFISGGNTNENPILIVKVFDENGINTVGSGIGHDITAILDDNINQPIILNDYYEADLNSYQSGTIRYQLKNLAEGRHTLRIKVWDTYNNSSEAFTEFYVYKNKKLVVDNVFNYPNPFSTNTGFYINHNQPCCYLDVKIKIFTLTGKLVKTIKETAITEGFQIRPIKWDGTDDFGDKLANGVYIYQVIVKDSNGNSSEKFEKLVILR